MVFANPKFHGQLIGRGGATLKKFREKHNVEVLFPDRLESDPKRASEIHIIGEKEAVSKAVEDLKQTVKNMVIVLVFFNTTLKWLTHSYLFYFECLMYVVSPLNRSF